MGDFGSVFISLRPRGARGTDAQGHGTWAESFSSRWAEEFVAATKDGLIVYDASQIEDTDAGWELGEKGLKGIQKGVLKGVKTSKMMLKIEIFDHLSSSLDHLSLSVRSVRWELEHGQMQRRPRGEGGGLDALAAQRLRLRLERGRRALGLGVRRGRPRLRCCAALQAAEGAGEGGARRPGPCGWRAGALFLAQEQLLGDLREVGSAIPRERPRASPKSCFPFRNHVKESKRM